jgi:hypothetical protein
MRPPIPTSVKRRLSSRCGLVAATLWLVAAVVRWWAAPAYERLPADYVAETSYSATLRSRQTPSSPVDVSESLVRRRDETLSGGEGYSVIQGDMHWLTTAGAVIFETFALYGVDRRDRRNLGGYGTEDRDGQYLFPPHTRPRSYRLWDPTYGGPSEVRFERVERFHGMEVYVFGSTVDRLDETAGYTSLPDIPERYLALTYGRGLYWVEPRSGIVVDHADSGVSYFVAPRTGRRVGKPVNQWGARYTPATIDAQLRRARTTRWHMETLEVWLPLTLSAAGLLLMAMGRRPRCGADA